MQVNIQSRCAPMAGELPSLRAPGCFRHVREGRVNRDAQVIMREYSAGHILSSAPSSCLHRAPMPFVAGRCRFRPCRIPACNGETRVEQIGTTSGAALLAFWLPPPVPQSIVCA